MDKISPLDLLAFNGKGIVSESIKIAQEISSGCGDFSHVGIAVTTEILPPKTLVLDNLEVNLEDGKVYVFESGFSKEIVDVVTKKSTIGVQLRDLTEIYEKSETSISCLKLKNNPWDRLSGETDEELLERRKNVKDKFVEIFKNYEGRFYEMDAITMASTVVPILRPVRKIKDDFFKIVGKKIKKNPNDWQFCSELVTRIYQEYDIIDKSIDPSTVVPSDFTGHDIDGIPNIIREIIIIK